MKIKVKHWYSILIFCGIFLLPVIDARAQQSELDAEVADLKQQLKIAKDDTARMYILSDLSFIYGELDPTKGVEYGNRALALANKLNWPRGKAYVQNNLGNLYTMLSDYPKALEFFFKALKNNEIAKHEKAIASNYGNIGIVYFRQKNYEKARTYYERSLALEKQLNNKHGVSSDLLNIGLIYRQQGNLSKALDYYSKALTLDQELNDLDGIAANLVNIGSIYEEQRRYAKALEFYHASLDIDIKRGNISGMGANYGSLGSVYVKILKDSTKNPEDYPEIANNKMELAMQAKTNLLKGAELLRSTKALYELQLVYNNLSELSLYQNKFEDALIYYKIQSGIKDSIFSQENEARLSSIEFQRTADIKQKEIEIQKLQLSKVKNQRVWLLVGLFLSGILAFFIFKQRAKSEKLLLNILPKKIASRLKQKEYPIADQFENASIVFIDIVGFTDISDKNTPKDLVALLNKIFIKLDDLVEKYGLEKIKTIGDCYMAVGGVPDKMENHADAVAQFALEAREKIKGHITNHNHELNFRTGIDAGAVVAGVIGNKKFIYDLWGDAVNTASRMESTGEQGKIQITSRFRKELKGNYKFIERGSVNIKGKGMMETYFLEPM